MLTHRMRKTPRTVPPKLCFKKSMRQACLFQFPFVQGLEDISKLLNQVRVENLFVSLLNACPLQPIDSEKKALTAERMIEYLNRAFEKKMPKEVSDYSHVLLMLIEEYNQKHTLRAGEGMLPHEFLKALLVEDNLSQKSLVPDCFRTESQVSEFLHQKVGRKTLSYDQAVALGKRFHVDPLIFLKS